MNQVVTQSGPSKQTELALQGYFSRLSGLHGAEELSISTGKSFAIEPSVEQKLFDAIQQSAAFLSDYVNVELVRDLVGEKIFLGTDGVVISSTTNEERVGINPSDLTDKGYQCRTNNFDILLKWSLLNQWSKFPDFQKRLTDHLLKQQAHDHLMIGFNGTSYAPKSNRVGNPLGQDVNIGWLQTIRNEASAHVDSSGNTFGENQTFKSLDALAYSARYELLDPAYRERNDLVVALGSAMVTDKYFGIMNKNDLDPSEYQHRDTIVYQKRIGAMQAVTPPYFPADTLLITPRKNLSIYIQEMSRRSAFEEKHASSGYVNWNQQNIDYVVEDFGGVALVENISEDNT